MSTYYDPQDINNRSIEARKARPMFYYKAVYNEQADCYDIILFMSIHNGDSGQTALDVMETIVRQKHISYYTEQYETFINKNYLHKNKFTFDDMLQLPSFAQKVEDLEYKIALPKSNKAYWALLKDFSIKLSHADINALNRIAGYVPEEKPKEEESDKSIITEDIVVKMLNMLKDINTRLTNLEQPLN